MLYQVLLCVALVCLVSADFDKKYLKKRQQRKLNVKRQILDSREGAVRLVDGDNYWEGRVEVFHDRTWNTVCDDWFSHENAQVICRQLGLTGGVPHGNAAFGQGTGNVIMDNLDCQGYEDGVTQCSANEWGDHNCHHYEDASVICDQPYPVNGAVRLANGPNAREGRVEIFYNSVWGTVCDDDWTVEEAQVTCRQLGYSNGHALEDNEYGDGEGQIWLDELNCSGSELELQSCIDDTAFWGNHDCFHFEDAGVICS